MESKILFVSVYHSDLYIYYYFLLSQSFIHFMHSINCSSVPMENGMKKKIGISLLYIHVNCFWCSQVLTAFYMWTWAHTSTDFKRIILFLTTHLLQCHMRNRRTTNWQVNWIADIFLSDKILYCDNPCHRAINRSSIKFNRLLNSNYECGAIGACDA